MDKRIFICIVIIFFLAVSIALFFKYFEIVQKKTPVQPSSDYYRNSYLALERWLAGAGYTVNSDDWFSVSEEKEHSRDENTIIIMDSRSLYFEESAGEDLTKWISGGKNLIICLDYFNYANFDDENDVLLSYLSENGIIPGTTPDYYDYSDEDMPDLYWRCKFDIKNEKDFFTVRDIHNNIRVVRKKIGKGSLTVLGNPIFMENTYLNKEKNARLTWKLIGEQADKTGVLFIREYSEKKTQKPLFGTLMQRGNIVPVLVSVFILIILGFWSVIPVFGLVKKEKQRYSRPIKDRFLAEISFLKKYKGLYYYDDAINKLKGGNNEKN